jgi:hypothetical protein
MLPQATPLPWRKITHLHRSLGPRALRFAYPGGVGMPLTASPATIATPYASSAGIDRIVGFTLSIAQTALATDFTMRELNTGWQFGYSYNGGRSLFIMGNVETLPDMIDLQFSFDTQLASNVYLSFFNFEVVPVLVT